MITFYHASFSCSLAVKAALTACGAQFETQLVNLGEGEHLAPEFLKINPMGKVPAIKVGGAVLTEGAAINLFIAEKYPNAQLMPENGSIEKANALKWLLYMYGTLHPAFSRVFFPRRYGEGTVKSVAETEVHNILAIIDQQLSVYSFIAGDDLTLADLYLMTVIHWEKVLEKPIIENYQNIAKFEQRMFAAPVIGDVFKDEYSAK